MSDGCGASVCELLRISAQDSLWRKIPHRFFRMIEGARLAESSGRWPRSGTMLNGTSSPLPTLAHRTGAKEFSPFSGEDGRKCSRSRTSTSADAAATPIASDATNTQASVRASRLARPTILNWSIESGELLPTPTASEGKFSIVGHSQRSKCLNALAIGKLNPEFPEWLMGFPIGWTDLGASGTHASRRSSKSSGEQ